MARARLGAGRDMPPLPARLRAAVSLDTVENELEDSKVLALGTDAGLATAVRDAPPFVSPYQRLPVAVANTTREQRAHVEGVAPGPQGVAVLETVAALAHAAAAPPPDDDGADARTRLMQRCALSQSSQADTCTEAS
jgi:hypothetical protein